MQGLDDAAAHPPASRRRGLRLVMPAPRRPHTLTLVAAWEHPLVLQCSRIPMLATFIPPPQWTRR